MSSEFNTLLHGSLDDVADMLSGDNPPRITESNISAILTNICTRVARIERRECAGENDDTEN